MQEHEIRQEIALRIWRETLIPGETIARWTGLSGEQVRTLVKGVRRLEGGPVGRDGRGGGGLFGDSARRGTGIAARQE